MPPILGAPREYKPVPVDVAAKIAGECNKDVVILSIDNLNDLFHATSFGRAARDKSFAAAWADLLMSGADLIKQTSYQDFRGEEESARNAERARSARTLLAAVDHALGSLLAVREGLTDEFLQDLREKIQAELAQEE